jgi:hypothetical protein
MTNFAITDFLPEFDDGIAESLSLFFLLAKKM